MTKTVTLGEICKKILSGGTPSTDKQEYWGGDIPWITSADIRDYFTVSPRKYLTQKANVDVLPAGNILVVTRVGLGKVVVNQQDLAFSQDLQGLILKPEVDNRYLVYALSEKVQLFKTIGRGATIKGVTREDLVNIRIPLPELPEQRRIAALLDRADALRQKDRQLLAHYDKLAQSIFLDLFGDPVTNEKGWEIQKLNKSCKKITVGFVGQCEQFYTDETGVPIIRTGNLRDYGLDLRALKYVTKEFHQKNKKSHVTKGDILIARHGDNGKACLVESAMEANTLNIVILSPDTHRYEGQFLLNVFNSESMRNFISSKTGGATQKVINTKAIQELLFPVPPLSLQTQFARAMEQIEQQKAVVRQQMAASEGLFARLLQESFG